MDELSEKTLSQLNAMRGEMLYIKHTQSLQEKSMVENELILKHLREIQRHIVEDMQYLESSQKIMKKSLSESETEIKKLKKAQAKVLQNMKNYLADINPTS